MIYGQRLRAVMRYWWLVLAVVVLSTSVGVLVTLRTQKQYATAVTFFVQTPSDQLSVAAQGDTFGQKRVNSYVQLAETDRLIKPVLADTKLPLTVGQLTREITASGDINTVLLTVRVTDPSPERSLVIATSVSVQFVKLVANLESTSTDNTSSVRLELVSGPTLDAAPVEPRPTLNLGIAIALGLMIGVGLAVFRDVRDTSIRSSQALERASGAAVIGVIQFDQTAKTRPLIVDSHAQSVRAEAFRQLRTNLAFVDVDKPVRTIVITSSVPEEGKSCTATNLAVIFAEAGKKVLLIEADLRRPRVAEYLGIEGGVGLTNLLAGQVTVDEVLQPWGRGGLTVLPSGSVPPNPSELLGSHSMTQLLHNMEARFDIVLIDTPPLLPVTDAAIVAAQADGAVLIVRHGNTTRHQVTLAQNALEKVGARLLGSVMNMAPRGGADSYQYGYSYGGGYSATILKASRLGAESKAAAASADRTPAAPKPAEPPSDTLVAASTVNGTDRASH